MLDDTTPIEVWREYESRKADLVARRSFSPAAYFTAIERIADELGLGVAHARLTDKQRAAQAKAIARHRGSKCAP